MYAPVSPEPEWFEIYNSANNEININRFLVSDGKDTIQIDTTVIYIQPKEYALVANDTFVTTKYNLEGTIIIQPFPSLSNSGDKLFICDSLGRTIDSVEFKSSWGGTRGKSLERISEYTTTIDSSNWNESNDERGATPLRINSVSQKLFDIAIDTAYFQPSIPKLNTEVNLYLTAKNNGRKAIDFTASVIELNFTDSTEIKTLASKHLSSVDSASSITMEFPKLIESIDDKKLVKVLLTSDKDQDTSNNMEFLPLIPSYLRGDVIVNEFMIYPAPGEPEWIELLNISNDTVNIFDWQIADQLTHPSQRIINNSEVKLLPGEYLVIAKDSSIYDFHRHIPSKVIISDFPNMNNDADAIIIKDANGISVDSVFYDQSWDIMRGYSFERIDKNVASGKNNFGLSTDTEQSTPGRINSIAKVQRDSFIKNILITPSFPGYNEEINFKIIIANRGSEKISNILIDVYLNQTNSPWYSSNVANINPFDSTTIIIDKQYSLLDSVVVTATVSSIEDENIYNNSYSKTFYSGLTKNSVLINEIMISPSDGNEWIEFFNNSGKRINLKNYSIQNLSPSLSSEVLTSNDFFIESDDYFILATDTIKGINNQIVIDFGSLSESNDGIVIKDFRGSTLDSLFYNNDFNIKRGRSIERIDKNERTAFFDNWYPSLDPTGNTCGKDNSVELLSSYNNNEILINEIMYDPSQGKCEYIEFYNNSSNKEVNLGGMQLIKNDSITIELSPQYFYLHPNEFFLLASDSSIIDWVGKIYNLQIEKFTLSNTGDKLLLTDFYGNEIDYLEYSPKWHFQGIIDTKGKSLERLNYSLPSNFPDTWSSCVSPEGGTPLKLNSVYTKEGMTTKGLSFSVNPFSPDGDGFEDFTLIKYSLSSSPSLVRIRIFDDLGRLVRTLSDSKPSGQTGEIVFDGLSDDGKHLRVGMYIVLLEAIGNDGKTFESFKKVLVIATKF
ncbi:MAG: hypothetical protein D6830_01500 [Ignavibacteria bacterium]|nr:MAG: hypothetical protein D6830_01500 [Ignavibacteria bacterium]